VKLFIYAHSFAPNVGGAESYVRFLCESLVGSPHDIEITIATRTPSRGFDDAALPFRVIREPSLIQVWSAIRDADLVHLAGPVLVPLSLGLLQRKPIVVRHHGYQACCPNGLLLYEPTKSRCSGSFMERKYGTCVVCNSGVVGWRQSLAMLAWTFPRRALSHLVTTNIHNTHATLNRLDLPRSTVVYHGVADPLSTNLDSLDGKTNDPRTTVCFGYVGRLVSEKGLTVLLQAAASLHDGRVPFRLKFIGDGPERPSLASMANQLGLTDLVTFTGFKEGAQLAAEVSDVTAVVMPSIWEETAGLSAVEHMIRGRLVIASDIGGLGEMVDKAGLKCPPGDVAALASCMRRVVEDPTLAPVLGRLARQRAQDLFSRDVMVRDHMAVFTQAIQGR
jgi:glycosyltransferase involved in cell wall biosynthesis